MTSKKKLGQFYTTNYDYILKGFKIPSDFSYTIIEPFAGNGDLLNFLGSKSNKFSLECYDIEPKKDWIIQRDTILNPPDFTNKFLLTNPPYLARNKSTDKTYYDKYGVNDLYKCHIIQITQQSLIGGILIIPLNFWCSMRKSDIELRKKFLQKYTISRVNFFEEPVFNDTDYSVCSFQFERKKIREQEQKGEDVYKYPERAPSSAQYLPIEFYIYPCDKLLICQLSESNNYTIGGEIYKLPQTHTYKIGRLIKGTTPSTNILLKCIDDNVNSQLGLSIQKEYFYDNTKQKSERSYATITIEPKISEQKQKSIVEQFNSFLREKRNIYNSLFLSNYRENARKRISFELSFQIINYLLFLEEQNIHSTEIIQPVIAN